MVRDATASRLIGPASAGLVSVCFPAQRAGFCALIIFIIFTLFSYLYVPDIKGSNKIRAKDMGGKNEKKDIIRSEARNNRKLELGVRV